MTRWTYVWIKRPPPGVYFPWGASYRHLLEVPFHEYFQIKVHVKKKLVKCSGLSRLSFLRWSFLSFGRPLKYLGQKRDFKLPVDLTFARRILDCRRRFERTFSIHHLIVPLNRKPPRGNKNPWRLQVSIFREPLVMIPSWMFALYFYGDYGPFKMNGLQSH